ncbi:MAG: hypothetical protein RIQ87_619 [Chloroflexota bacterium]
MERDPRIQSQSAAALRASFVAFFEKRDHTPVPSASLVPAGDATLLFTNSGMVQFKGIFSGAETRSYARAVDYQRCLRVAGKHNDFEEVGRTPRHHTLFEMLGSWSFGDYFKREAIVWAWEFLTVEVGIPADRLAATVYTDDEEAAQIWLNEVKLPRERLARWGNVDAGNDANFWRMAETGPCGPCSEIHFDRGADLSCGPDCLPDHSEHCPRWLEIWNLVFMQYEQHPDGRRTELPFKSVDTGMGLERLASVSQQVLSNYDTDLFLPLHEALRSLTGHKKSEFEAHRFSYQVIADHARAVTFLLADGVRPSNEGRGYVARRIVRRAVRHGRILGLREAFLSKIVSSVIATMSDAYPYLHEAKAGIIEALEREEAQFARTLDGGSELLAAAIAPLVTTGTRTVGQRADDLPVNAPQLDGETAFKLHDTYGFPIDLTIELAAESGVAVDRAGFDAALLEQRERSRGGKKTALAEHAATTARLEDLLRVHGETRFIGYEHLSANVRVLALLVDGLPVDEIQGGASGQMVVAETPFYAERGGQVGDQGAVSDSKGKRLARITDTQRPLSTLALHEVEAELTMKVGDTVEIAVDAARRERTMRNHTATHLLHRAIRVIAGPEAKQRGSLVHPDYLRFDYPLDRALTDAELDATENEVQRAIREDLKVTIAEMTMKEAVTAGADAFFDEKYGERVRTVQLEAYSHELCGGTHCTATGQVGNFVITSERSIGSGLRRVEALTGDAADQYLRARSRVIDEAATLLGVQEVALVAERISALQKELKEARRRARSSTGGSLDIAKIAAATPENAAGMRALVALVDLGDLEAVKDAAKRLREKLGAGVIALVNVGDVAEIFVTAEGVNPSQADAGALATGAAAAVGGRGGGRPAMGQGRGADGGDPNAAVAALAQALGVTPVSVT